MSSSSIDALILPLQACKLYKDCVAFEENHVKFELHVKKDTKSKKLLPSENIGSIPLQSANIVRPSIIRPYCG